MEAEKQYLSYFYNVRYFRLDFIEENYHFFMCGKCFMIWLNDDVARTKSLNIFKLAIYWTH